MSLSSIVFKANPTREVEVLGKKIIVRGLTTKDTLDMDINLLEFMESAAGSDKQTDLKTIVKGMIEFLAAAIVSIDGQIPESKEETKQFLLDQDYGIISAIFAEVNKDQIAEVAETKKSEETQP